jgi:hypothetical protein
MISSPKIETKLLKRKHDSNSDDDSADPNNNVTNVSEPVQCQLRQKNLIGQNTFKTTTH